MQNAAIKRALLMHMPMYFNGLVVENTSRCNARCGMCYQAAGPRGTPLWGIAALPIDVLERVVREAIEIEAMAPRFHLAGGESFLDIDSCVRLFSIAHETGYHDITTTTNAYWARKPEKARAVCERIREAGLTSMEISWDIWHLPYIAPEAVSNCLEACREFGIVTNLRTLSTRSHSFDEALSHLRPEALECADRITCGPVFPTGRAATEIDRSDIYENGELNDSCHSVLNLTVNSLGNVYPCCSGIDQTNTFVFGNIKNQSIRTIAEAMNRSPMLRTIVFGGIAELLPIIEQSGVPIDRDYASICHMCWSIFSRPDCVAAIRDYFADLQQIALQNAISAVETKYQAPASVEEASHA